MCLGGVRERERAADLHGQRLVPDPHEEFLGPKDKFLARYRALLTALYPVVVKVSYFFWSNIGSNGLVGTIPGPTDVPQFPTDTQLNLLADNVFNRVADLADALGRPAAEVAVQRDRAHEAECPAHHVSPWNKTRPSAITFHPSIWFLS